ncbi:MAG: multidrug transporter ATPase [Marmoricola sp.]|jgi:ABC-2 type transport system ATP-binding protein|nr:multidrug transporter ATPase [Marmoricola sp.]
MNELIEATNVTKNYRGVRALDDVTLSISENSITGLLGRNGAGKTTLMSLLTAQDFLTSGSVKVFGEDPLENDKVLSRMCFIRESQRYPNNFKVRHVLAAGENFYPDWDAELAASLVEEFRLPAGRQVEKLSRGMRSSVGILLGLASRAPITIFDEPYLGLDATARQQFYDVLLREYAENPRTIVLSTHLIDEVSGLLSDVLVLNDGRLVMAGAADDLRQRATVLTGKDDRVAIVAAGLPVLHREALGAYTALTVDARLDDERRALAQSMSVEIQPVSLQTLVVRAGLSETAGAADRTLSTIGGAR